MILVRLNDGTFAYEFERSDIDTLQPGMVIVVNEQSYEIGYVRLGDDDARMSLRKDREVKLSPWIGTPRRD